MTLGGAGARGPDSLGIDIGTTYTAAAVLRDGRAEILTLGVRAAAVPSLVFLRDDESLLVGEAAERRGVAEPQRLAREFKRRVGDTTPILVGPSPYSAERLTAQLLRWVVGVVAEREGSLPERVAVAHPANWGEYKVGLMRQAVELAGLGGAILVSEPVAAAVHYAANERIDVGEAVAVYDLGGGTFDAAVLRRTPDGFEVLGRPEGIERLGGIDFDDAIVTHVRRALGDRATELDGDDPGTAAARARLRQECTAAKEVLSTDTDTTIHVALPNGGVDVRLTRSEFEAMIRPPLRETIAALRRAIDGASLAPEQLRAVLLVGGSSRIPLVAEMVGAELGRPVAVDSHPKHAVALGAARYALRDRVESAAAPAAPAAPAAAPPLERTPTPRGARRPRRRAPIVITVAVIALAAAIGAAVVLTGGGEGGSSEETDPPRRSETTVDAGDTTIAEEECIDVAASGRCAWIEDIRLEDDHYVVEYSTEGFEPLMQENGGTADDHHVHFFFDTYDVDQVGTNVPETDRGVWTVWDLPEGDGDYIFNEALVADRGDASELCVGVADAAHGIDPEFADCGELPS
jgi:actin-like ATPase involved in cell morphogenesis